jgi:hypothetical protein
LASRPASAATLLGAFATYYRIGALKAEALRERIETSLAATPLVLLSTVCAREVVMKVGVVAASFVWIERTSPTLMRHLLSR